MRGELRGRLDGAGDGGRKKGGGHAVGGIALRCDCFATVGNPTAKNCEDCRAT
jgi:hypothetical protein